MKKFGRGLATIMFGFGYGEGFPDHSIASIEIKEDERIVIRTAAADVGQGVITTVIQIAAEILRISPNYFEVVQGDTHKTKNSGSTSATRQTYFTGNAVKKAAEDMLANLYHYGSIEFRSNHPEIAIEDGKIYMYDDPDDYIAGFPAHPHRGFETARRWRETSATPRRRRTACRRSTSTKQR